MADYWVSGKKYWCEYCGIFVTDNKISRTNHDTGNKHKNNVQRYLRQVVKSKEQKKREEIEASKILAQVEQAAMKAFQKDVETGLVSAPSSSSTSSFMPPAMISKKLPTKQQGSGNPPSFYAQNQQPKKSNEQGQTQEEEAAEEEEDKDPYASTIPGAWETVEIPPPVKTYTAKVKTEDEKTDIPTSSGGTKLGSMFIPDEEDGDHENLRNFRVVEKKVSLNDDEEELGDDDSQNSGSDGDGAGKKRKLTFKKFGKNKVKQETDGDGDLNGAEGDDNDDGDKESSGLFKKRKLGGEKKIRNIRKKE